MTPGAMAPGLEASRSTVAGLGRKTLLSDSDRMAHASLSLDFISFVGLLLAAGDCGVIRCACTEIECRYAVHQADLLPDGKKSDQ